MSEEPNCEVCSESLPECLCTLDCCVECWEPFRYDDVGGYNPPCSCGLHCGRCHEIELEREADRDDDDADRYYPPEFESEASTSQGAVPTPSLTLPPSEPRHDH